MFVSAVAAELLERAEEAGEKAQAADTPFRFSGALDCSRKLALRAAGFKPTDPMDAPGLVVTERGTLMHELVQEAIGKRFPGAEFELKSQVDIVDVDSGEQVGLTSGHCDALIPWNGKRYIWELKNVGNFAYTKATGIPKGYGSMTNPEGPRLSAVVQGALNALAHEADEVVVAYIATEAISVQRAEKLGIGVFDRIMSEWLIPEDVWRPLARAEIKRLRGIRESLKVHEIPVAVAIDDKGDNEELSPHSSKIPWQCAYCSHRSLCVQLPRFPVTIQTVEGLA